MNANLNESSIEHYALDLFQSLGWEYVFGPDIAPDVEKSNVRIAKRKSFEDVLLLDILESRLKLINPQIPDDAINDAIKTISNVPNQFPNLMANNEAFHRLLTEGIRVTYRKNGEEKGDIVKLIDFKNIENNDFRVINQFTVIENNINKRPDIVLFVNGIPLVIIELKNPADENATIQSAYNQIQTYKQTIPSFFSYNEIIVISDGLEAKIGSLSAGYDRFTAWKSMDDIYSDAMQGVFKFTQLEILIKGLFNKETFLDFLRFFIVFGKSRTEDATGQTIVKLTKKIAAYHQYYAVNKAIESTLRAIGKNKEHWQVKESPASYGLPDVKKQPEGDRKAGVIWHTQGSGKSLSMVFYSAKIIQTLANPTIVVITDRNDLDDQLFDTFAASTQILRQEPVQAESREHIKDLLKVDAGGIIFSTIHKFWPDEGNIYETLSERENIIVIVDEAHRTQYGFKARVDKETGDIKYGFAKYLRDALPNATFIAFTGTPVEKNDRNTPAVFGNYIDIYDISRAVEDGVTVPIYYESRLVKIELTDEGKKILEEFEIELEGTGISEVEKAEIKWVTLENLIGGDERIKQVAEDIVKHFEQRLEVIDGKGMIVSMTRNIAVKSQFVTSSWGGRRYLSYHFTEQDIAIQFKCTKIGFHKYF